MIDRRLWDAGKNSRWLWLAIALSALGGLAVVAQAWLLSRSVDRAFLGGETRAQLAPLLLALLGAILLRAALAGARELAAQRVAADIKLALRDDLAGALLARGPLAAVQEGAGAQTAVLTSGIEALEAYFAEYLPQLFNAALIPLTILFFVLPADPLSGLVLLLTAPLMPLFMILIGHSAERLTRQQFGWLSLMSGHFLDVLQGLATLKQLGQSKRQAANIALISDQFRQATLRTLRVAFLSALVLELLATLSVAVVAVSIGLRLLTGSLTFQLGFFVLILAPEFYLPLRQLGQRFHAGMSGTAAAVEIFALLDTAASAALLPATAPTPRLPAPLALQNVTLTYPGRDQPALEDVSLTIAPGQTVALVGPSGAGKSSVAALLLKFATPEHGRVLAGATDLATVDAEAWRAQIAWVPQAPALFEGSIADNIRLARPEATAEAVAAAAEQAQLGEFIAGLAQGYETAVGERGLRLSGGQAQRLALARAFLKDAPLLILDEPTAHLDPQTEAELRETTRALMAGRTVLLIAHRLRGAAGQPAPLQEADQIVVLEDGRVAAQGTHEELLAGDSLYAQWLASVDALWSVPAEAPANGPLAPAATMPPASAAGRSDLRRLLGFVAPYGRRVALAVLLGALTIGSGVALLAISAYLIAAAALQPSIAELQVAIVGVRFFGISRGLLRYLERLVTHDVTFRVLADIRVWFYKTLEPLAPAALSAGDETSSAELLARFVADVETLQEFYVRVVGPPLVALLAGAGVLLFFGAFAWQLALVMLVFLLLAGVALPWWLHIRQRPFAAPLLRDRAALHQRLVEGVQGLADLLAFGQGAAWQKGVHTLGAQLATEQQQHARLSGWRAGLSELLAQSAMWAVLWLAIPLSADGVFPPVYLAALALAAVASFELVQPLPQAAQLLGASLAAARRLFAVVDSTPAVVETEGVAQVGSKDGRPPAIAARDVRFRYGAEGPWALDGLSFSLPAGRKLALVGRSGAGKSTLVALLSRFWEVEAGEITLDGRPLGDYAPETVRGQLGIVEQRPYLFNASIYENIRIARPGATRAEVMAAAAAAQLGPFLAALPDGLETRVGSLGMALSGGERQRVAIARALLRDAPVLVLDEPTANLDPATGQAILDTALALAAEGRSLLLITHDAAALEAMDEVVWLGAG